MFLLYVVFESWTMFWLYILLRTYARPTRHFVVANVAAGHEAVTVSEVVEE